MTTRIISSPRLGGIRLSSPSAGALAADSQGFLSQLEQLDLRHYVDVVDESSLLPGGAEKSFQLRPGLAQTWAPGLDTTGLAAQLSLDTERRAGDLEREIVLAMLLGPVAFEFPDHAELACSVRVRRNIVLAARKTALDFHTSATERPEDCWTYDAARGFTVRPGQALIAALAKATQPEVSGKRYAFSCYRATEYVLLLALAQELAHSNRPLLGALQRQWERRALMAEEFQHVFLREYGSLDAPLPLNYYVPGDRVWFRNPDAHSSDVAGYEGSWVIYLGNGLFSNFWTQGRPYTLTAKCLELFHWRHATYTDPAGELCIDEGIVEARVKATLANPAELAQILESMLQLRGPQGVYEFGGCLDASREYPRRLCPGSADLVLPAA
jgi:Protein-glutamine gamma-glutamyltransferase